jgi:hypothetical protein
MILGTFCFWVFLTTSDMNAGPSKTFHEKYQARLIKMPNVSSLLYVRNGICLLRAVCCMLISNQKNEFEAKHVHVLTCWTIGACIG